MSIRDKNDLAKRILDTLVQGQEPERALYDQLSRLEHGVASGFLHVTATLRLDSAVAVKRLFDYVERINPYHLGGMLQFTAGPRLRELLQRGAPIEFKNRFGETVLDHRLQMFAGGKTYTQDLVNDLIFLIQSGAQLRRQDVSAIFFSILKDSDVGPRGGDLTRILAYIPRSNAPQSESPAIPADAPSSFFLVPISNHRVEVYLDELNEEDIGGGTEKQYLRDRLRDLPYFWWVRRRCALTYPGPMSGPYYSAIWSKKMPDGRYGTDKSFDPVYQDVQQALTDVLGRDTSTHMLAFL